MEIDELFAKSNETFTIDNSKQNLHWQKMQNAIAAKKVFKAKIKYGIVATFTIVAIAVVSLLKVTPTKKGNAAEITNNNPINTSQNTATPNTTIIVKKDSTTTYTVPIAIKKTTPTIIQNNAIAQLQTNFYIDLSKAPETFIIDQTKDTTLTCKQGTTITIPANTVVDNNNKTVTVAIQEYYNYQNNTANAGMVKYTFYNTDNILPIANENAVTVKMKTEVANIKNVKVLHSSDAMSDVQFKKMQWVTYEKFTTNNNIKNDFIVQLPKAYNANTFMSQLAFVNHNAIIAGDIINNSIVFRKVPQSETVFFTSIGKVNDKYFSCSKKLTTGTNNIIQLDFIEISEVHYKKQIEELGKLGQ